MKRPLPRFAIPLLRWTLGLVVIVESVRFVLSASAAHFLAKAGLAAWIQPALGAVEILAAVLFLVPLTEKLGSYALLAVFALAVLIHVLHGQFEVGGLVVYAAAVVACMAYRNNESTGAQHA